MTKTVEQWREETLQPVRAYIEAARKAYDEMMPPIETAIDRLANSDVPDVFKIAIANETMKMMDDFQKELDQ